MKIEIAIPIYSIKEENKKNFESKLKKENIDINDFEQIIKRLKLDKTSTCKLLKFDSNSTFNENANNAELSINNPHFSFILNLIDLYQNDTHNNLLLSSLESTAVNSEVIENSSKIIVHDFIERKFNSARISHCLKHKLYDITLTPEFNNFNHPIKYKISDEYFSFVYPSELIITFCITVSGILFKTNMLNSDKIYSEYKGSKFNHILGLFFCGKNIKLNENTIKKCAPNEFICKNCVEINKKIYNLKNHYLINIYGRISKKNKGVYHCFGNFLVNNQIEECITSYVCKACSFLNSFRDYYNN
jgi:hypothetical protein